MNIKSKSGVWGTSFIVISALLSSCGGSSSGDSNTAAPITETQIDVSQASLVTSASKFSGGSNLRSSRDFRFPEVVSQNGSFSMSIPNGMTPKFPARRKVASGNGQVIQFSDPVSLKYDMFSWSTGELVDSSAQYDEAHIVKSGVTDGVAVPDYLAKSLLGRSLGDTIQVILPAGTEDLPDYLDSTDAYVMLVELL